MIKPQFFQHDIAYLITFRHIDTSFCSVHEQPYAETIQCNPLRCDTFLFYTAYSQTPIHYEFNAKNKVTYIYDNTVLCLRDNLLGIGFIDNEPYLLSIHIAM